MIDGRRPWTARVGLALDEPTADSGGDITESDLRQLAQQAADAAESSAERAALAAQLAGGIATVGTPIEDALEDRESGAEPARGSELKRWDRHDARRRAEKARVESKGARTMAIQTSRRAALTELGAKLEEKHDDMSRAVERPKTRLQRKR